MQLDNSHMENNHLTSEPFDYLLLRQLNIPKIVIPAPHGIRDKLQPGSRRVLDAPGLEPAGAGLSGPA